MLHYILQVVAFQLVFLIIYDVFLRKETFFSLNRAYLLITASLSVGIPFIKIEQIKTVVAKDFVIRLPEVIIGDATEAVSTIDPQIAMQAGINLEPEPISIWNLILISGMCIAILVLLFKISKLVWLAQKHPRQWKGNLLIIELLNSTKAFSFFHYIFLGEKLNTQEKQSILEHEIIHVNQKHTLDLLFFELFRIVFWFNPLVYMYQNRIATLHEYIVDAKAVKQNDKTDYYNNLLSQVFETEQFSFVNPFFKHSLIKKRILMLSKSKSKQIQLLKYALLIPMVFTMLIYTSSYAQEKKNYSSSEIENQNSQELSDEALFNKYYNEIIELDNNGVEFDNIYNSYKANTDKYILIREDYYKNTALFKFIFSKRAIQLEEDGQLDAIDREYMERFSKFKPYQKYLDYKKTDEAKLSWESAIKDGVLRMVFDDLGNWTEEEEKKFNKKLDLVEKDDFYRELLVTSIDGRTKMIVHDVSRNGESTTASAEETEIIEPSVEVPFATVDEVPTFTFCDTFKTQEERKQCMTDNIAMHVNKNFNTDLATQLGLVGRQRINVIFKIGKDGFVTGAKARAPHPKLEEEAIRVINTLPQFIPGKHKGMPVTVPYSLPIIFQVQSEKIPDENNTVNVTSVEDVKQVLRDNERSKIQDPKEVPFMRVDEAPMYESCVGFTSQKNKKACVSKDISMFVNKNFNIKLAKELNLIGRQNISVLFKIDELGYVKGVKARASHPDLEKEAMRVIKALPQFIPGKHDGEPVTVLYSLPISFLDATNQDKKN